MTTRIPPLPEGERGEQARRLLDGLAVGGDRVPMTVGFYTMTAMAPNIFGVEIDPGLAGAS